MEPIYQVSIFPAIENIIVPIAFCILGPVVLYRAVKNKNQTKRTFNLFWGGVVTATAPLLLVYSFINQFSVYLTLAANDYEISTGIVEVLRTQPQGGHAAGDLIRVGNKEFEIDYFAVTPCYNKTISNGGALTTGKHVTLYSNSGCILKIVLSDES